MEHTNACHSFSSFYVGGVGGGGSSFFLFGFTLRYSILAMWIAIMPRYFNDGIKGKYGKKTKHYTRTTTSKRSSSATAAAAAAVGPHIQMNEWLNEWMGPESERISTVKNHILTSPPSVDEFLISSFLFFRLEKNNSQRFTCEPSQWNATWNNYKTENEMYLWKHECHRLILTGFFVPLARFKWCGSAVVIDGGGGGRWW